MKRLVALLLSLSLLLTACATPINSSDSSENSESSSSVPEISSEPEVSIEYADISDSKLHKTIEDAIYRELVLELGESEIDYFVENVDVVHYSKEYIEELAFNSAENVYFGYEISNIEEVFGDNSYVFNVSEDNETIVEEFKPYDDTLDRIISNVITGTGVILICVTVSAVTAGISAPISMIFAASAKAGTANALIDGTFSGVFSGITTGIQTEDFDEALKSAALSASEGFKWGAIVGSIAGGIGEAIALRGATLKGLTMTEAAIAQREGIYSLSTIKNFSSMQQYEMCKALGLTETAVNQNIVLIRNIDWNFVDDLGRSNATRVADGLAPLDPDGIAYQLHHIGQEADSPLAILTQAEHMQNGNNIIWHDPSLSTNVHGTGSTWDAKRKELWKLIHEIQTS